MSSFHIHVDASWLSQDFEAFLLDDLGFRRTDFVGPDGGKTEPLNHLTLKARTSRTFRTAFKSVTDYARTHSAMIGYIEGEFVRMDRSIPSKQFDANIQPPFKLELGSLPAGTFRESEIHLTLCPERSDRRLVKMLRDMGLLMIYMPKASGIALIFTAQGTKAIVSDIAVRLWDFLEMAGGAFDCSLKEERIAKWWLSGQSITLPPVVHRIWCGSELIVG